MILWNAKNTLEQFARDKGITIEGYCTDNGIFKDNTWMHAGKVHNQTLRFAAVDAHY